MATPPAGAPGSAIEWTVRTDGAVADVSVGPARQPVARIARSSTAFRTIIGPPRGTHAWHERCSVHDGRVSGSPDHRAAAGQPNHPLVRYRRVWVLASHRSGSPRSARRTNRR